MTSSTSHAQPCAPAPIQWAVTRHDGFAVAQFTITDKNGILSPAQLNLVTLPQGVRMHEGIIFSGRGPVWLYGYLTHLAHPFRWVAIHDPRLQHAVVIEHHSVDPPHVGTLIPIPQEQSS